jgi:thiamine biosynthesis protein ThiC
VYKDSSNTNFQQSLDVLGELYLDIQSRGHQVLMSGPEHLVTCTVDTEVKLA